MMTCCTLPLCLAMVGAKNHISQGNTINDRILTFNKLINFLDSINQYKVYNNNCVVRLNLN